MGGTGSHVRKLTAGLRKGGEGKVLIDWWGGANSGGLDCDCHYRRLQCGPSAASVSDMEEREEGEETLAAIDRGIKAADEGRTVPLEEVRKMISKWTRKFESRERRSRTKSKLVSS